MPKPLLPSICTILRPSVRPGRRPRGHFYAAPFLPPPLVPTLPSLTSSFPKSNTLERAFILFIQINVGRTFLVPSSLALSPPEFMRSQSKIMINESPPPSPRLDARSLPHEFCRHSPLLVSEVGEGGPFMDALLCLAAHGCQCLNVLSLLPSFLLSRLKYVIVELRDHSHFFNC